MNFVHLALIAFLGLLPPVSQQASTSSSADNQATVTAQADSQQTDAPAKAPASGVQLPAWLKIGAQYRGRVESTRSIATPSGDADTYYLNRLRLRATIVASPWLSFTAEAHDMRVGEYNLVNAPRGYSNQADLRQAFVRVGGKAGKGTVVLQLGRQEMTLGEGRMIASADWGNSSRTFDLVRVIGDLPGFHIEAFGGPGTVQIDQQNFDRPVVGEHMFGVYTVFNKLAPGTTIEPYVLVRHNNVVNGERAGDRGDQTITTYGARSTHKLPAGLYVMTETDVQDGHVASDQQRAWATNLQLAWAVPHAPAGLRLSADYNTATGDSAYRDGQSNTFDQFYPTVHTLRGYADQFGFRNVRHVGGSMDITPFKNVKVNAAIHKLALNTVNDAFYNTSGSRVILNRGATSTDLGWEFDAGVTVTPQKYVTIGAALGTLFTGDFITQSGGVPRLYYPCVYWTAKF